jgi:outer membrane receptor protein involved in Fe transport
MLDALPPSPPADTIVVTGQALSDPPSEQAFHVDVITASELNNAPAQGLDEILKRVPGLQLFRRSDSTSGHPTSQGVTLRALGGNASSRALLILDGVPQADPFGGWVNWPAYDPAGLAEVRIVRGGGSLPYGPGAIAGVIEMRSLTSADFNASIEGGSRASVRGHAFAGQPIGSTTLTVDAHGARSDGFIPITAATRGAADREAPYENGSIRARWIAPVGGDVEAQLSGLAFADSRERGVDFTGNRTRGADASVRLVGRGHWQWSALAYAQWRTLRSSFASVSDDRSSAVRVSLQDSVPSRSLGFSAEVRPPVSRLIDLRVGADMRLTSGQSRELYSFVDGQPTRRRISGGDTETAGLFAEATVRRGNVMLSGGARIDRWTVDDGQLTERMLAGGALRDDQYARREGWLPTARLGAVVDLNQSTKLRAGAYRGWRMPTLNELFRPFRAGADATAANPDLKPEISSGLEAGVDFRRKQFEFSATAFVNRLHDAIANVTLGRGPGTFPGVGFVVGDYRQRQNVEAIRVRGIEADGELRAGPWSLGLGASLTDATINAKRNAAPLDGLRPAQTPHFAASASVTWERELRTFGVEVRHVGSQFDDDLNGRKLRPATTVSAFAALPISRTVQLTARAQNLLNETIEASINDDGSIEPASPRTLWVGLRLAAPR